MTCFYELPNNAENPHSNGCGRFHRMTESAECNECSHTREEEDDPKSKPAMA